jgi:hypothetical protein
MILSGLAVLGITLYYIYGTLAASDQLFRAILPGGQPMSAQDYQRNLANMELLTKVLLIAATVLTVCVVGRFYAYPETGLALIAVGGLLFVGMPYLIDHYGGAVVKLPRAALAGSTILDPRGFLKGRFGLVGLGMGGAGGLVLLMHAAALIATARSRRPQANPDAAKTANQVRKPNDRFLGPCWSLPFCRDTEKKLCPIRQTKKPCWRKGRGCYCDQNVILTLSGGNQYAASRGSTGYMSAAAAAMAKPKSLSEKRAQCLQCPVYLHHQGQKHRLLAPGSLVAVVAGMAIYWGSIVTGYPVAIRALGRATSTLSFGGQAGTVPAWAADLATNGQLMWILIFVVVMLVVSYLMHFVEWTLYKLGI